MKTILVTGGNGFLGKEISESEYFANYNLIITNRSSLNLLDKIAVDSFFNSNSIDYVLHAAICGGSRLKQDSFDDFISNLIMYQNLKNNAEKYKLLINFGSGAEFDRSRSIDNFEEEILLQSRPEDYYGHSKNIIAREILKQDNAINIRLFGCFGKYENSTRFITTMIDACLKNEDVFVDDKKMDFISTKDLFLLIEHVLKHDIKYKDVNAVYRDKVTMPSIAELIKDKTNSDSKVYLAKDQKNYSGSSSKIDSLDLKFDGLTNSVEKIINKRKV